MLSLLCPACGHEINMSGVAKGASAACPRCGTVVPQSATPGETATRRPAPDVTTLSPGTEVQTPRARAPHTMTASPDDTQATFPYDFLAPAQAPGELGRLGGYRVRRLLGEGAWGWCSRPRTRR